jgi:hypothetical protein
MLRLLSFLILMGLGMTEAKAGTSTENPAQVVPEELPSLHKEAEQPALYEPQTPLELAKLCQAVYQPDERFEDWHPIDFSMLGLFGIPNSLEPPLNLHLGYWRIEDDRMNVVLKGTDGLNVLLNTPQLYEDKENPEISFHGPMYWAAQSILSQLPKDNPPPKIIITGHSQGAGIGLILSLLTKEKYPEYIVNFTGFSVPAVINEKAQRRMKEQGVKTQAYCLEGDLIPFTATHGLTPFPHTVLPFSGGSFEAHSIAKIIEVMERRTGGESFLHNSLRQFSLQNLWPYITQTSSAWLSNWLRTTFLEWTGLEPEDWQKLSDNPEVLMQKLLEKGCQKLIERIILNVLSARGVARLFLESTIQEFYKKAMPSGIWHC